MTQSTVCITGASSGIGQQLARDYAKLGWRVIACGRNQKVLDALEQENTDIEKCLFDITDEAQTQTMLGGIKGDVNLWILNAGTCQYLDHGHIVPETVRHVTHVNFFGVVHAVAAIQSRQKASEHIAIVSSIASVFAFARAEAYGASKAALSYFVRALMIDRPQDKIALIMPGFVDTALTKKNDFPMPGIISVEKASAFIIEGLKKEKRFIHFPKRLTWFLSFLARLPFVVQIALARYIQGN